MGSIKSIGQIARYKPIAQCGMEELAARQINADPSGGVLFARKVDGEQKVAARQLVLDLFSRQNWPSHLNMLTMPGVHWRFERKLLGIREPGWTRRPSSRRTNFTGVENDRPLYFSAVSQMPGVETPNALIKPVRRDRFPFAELAVKTRHVSFFFADIDDFMRHDWQPPAYRERTGWDAAWLDYTGPLSVERLNIIRQFYHSYVRDILVVTALRARWNKATNEALTAAGGHSAWLRHHLPGEVLHDLEYFDTSPMAQFAVKRSQAAAAEG